MNLTAIASTAPSRFIGALRIVRAFNAANAKLINNSSLSPRAFSTRSDALLDSYVAARDLLLARFPKGRPAWLLRSNLAA